MKSVTIVQPRAAGIIHAACGGRSPARFGGAEIQSVHLSILLQRLYKVKFVTKKVDAQKKKEFVNLHIEYTYSDGVRSVRFLRFFYPRLICNIMALWRANSAIYYQRGPGEITGITALFCKLLKRKFIYAISGNGEIVDIKGKIKNPFVRLLYGLGLLLCDNIVCQTVMQKKLLPVKYRDKAIIIKNVYPDRIVGRRNIHSMTFGWVLNIGAYRALKRQTLFLELAKALYGTKFVCIGSGSGKYAKKLLLKAEHISNLEMTGHLPHEEVHRYLENAYCVVNCSDNEGFPNVFLEAWAHGVPVVSLGFDPDRVIDRFSMGIVVNSITGLEKAVRLYVENPDIRRLHGNNGKQYLEMYHSEKAILREFGYLFG